MDAVAMVDVLDLRVNAAGIILSAVSVSFGFISAYITGLYFFLHRAPLGLRLCAFGVLTLSLIFVILIAVGVSPLAGGLVAGQSPIDGTISDLASVRLTTDTAQTFLARMSSEVPLIYLIGWGIGAVLSANVYLALLYLTFLHRWDAQ